VPDLQPVDVVRLRPDELGDSEAIWMYVGDLFPQKPSSYYPVRVPRARVIDPGWDATHPRRLEVDDPALPRAIVMHDSFGVGIEPLLSGCFRRSTWLHDITFPTQAIEEEHPDVVLAIYVERVLATWNPWVVVEPRANEERRR
jgi:hypothetical protein